MCSWSSSTTAATTSPMWGVKSTASVEPGLLADRMSDIGQPAIDWGRLSESLGVEASRASSTAEFISQFDSAVRQRGPRLIEAVVPE